MRAGRFVLFFLFSLLFLALASGLFLLTLRFCFRLQGVLLFGFTRCFFLLLALFLSRFASRLFTFATGFFRFTTTFGFGRLIVGVIVADATNIGFLNDARGAGRGPHGDGGPTLWPTIFPLTRPPLFRIIVSARSTAGRKNKHRPINQSLRKSARFIESILPGKLRTV